MDPQAFVEQVIRDALHGSEDNRAKAVAASIVLTGITGARIKEVIPKSQMACFDALDQAIDVLITAVQALLETYEEDRAREVRRLLDTMTGAMLTYDTVRGAQQSSANAG